MYPDILSRVKTILTIEFDIEHDDFLKEIINNIASMVLLYIDEETLPTELEFVVVESAVSRYLRRGSEGFENESMGEISITYQEILTPYIPFLDKYKSKKNKVRFL